MHGRGACPRSSPFRHRAGRAPVSPPAAPRCRPGRRRGGPASGSRRRGPPPSRRAARARRCRAPSPRGAVPRGRCGLPCSPAAARGRRPPAAPGPAARGRARYRARRAADRDRRCSRCAAGGAQRFDRAAGRDCGNAGVESRLTLSSAGSSRAASNQGTRPSAAHPVSRSMTSLAPSKSVASPRNLLMTKPLVSARSGAGSSAQVPTRLAITPPRSTSPPAPPAPGRPGRSPCWRCRSPAG